MKTKVVFETIDSLQPEVYRQLSPLSIFMAYRYIKLDWFTGLPLRWQKKNMRGSWLIANTKELKKIKKQSCLMIVW